MSFVDRFLYGRPAEAPAAPPAAAPAATPAAPPANPTGSTSGTPASQQQQATNNSPLDNFKTLWHTPTDANGKPVQAPADPLTAPLFTPKMEDVMAQANQLDFMGSVKPELLTKALGGDAAALAEAINTAVRAGLVASTQVSTDMVNNGVIRNNQNFRAALPNQIRTVQTAQMQSENPALSHPAVAPLVAAHKAQLLRLRPNATPEELQAEVETYFGAMAEAISGGDPAKKAAQAAAAAKETNWSQWANT